MWLVRMQAGLTKFGYKLEKEVVVTLMFKYGNFTQLFASKSSKFSKKASRNTFFFSIAKWWKLAKKEPWQEVNKKG